MEFTLGDSTLCPEVIWARFQRPNHSIWR